MDIAVKANSARVMTGQQRPDVDRRWSRTVMVLLSLTGLITPVVCFAAAPVAFALSHQDDGLLLAGIGGTHLLLAWALFGAI